MATVHDPAGAAMTPTTAAGDSALARRLGNAAADPSVGAGTAVGGGLTIIVSAFALWQKSEYARSFADGSANEIVPHTVLPDRLAAASLVVAGLALAAVAVRRRRPRPSWRRGIPAVIILAAVPAAVWAGVSILQERSVSVAAGPVLVGCGVGFGLVGLAHRFLVPAAQARIPGVRGVRLLVTAGAVVVLSGGIAGAALAGNGATEQVQVSPFYVYRYHASREYLEMSWRGCEPRHDPNSWVQPGGCVPQPGFRAGLQAIRFPPEAAGAVAALERALEGVLRDPSDAFAESRFVAADDSLRSVLGLESSRCLFGCGRPMGW